MALCCCWPSNTAIRMILLSPSTGHDLVPSLPASSQCLSGAKTLDCPLYLSWAWPNWCHEQWAISSILNEIESEDENEIWMIFASTTLSRFHKCFTASWKCLVRCLFVFSLLLHSAPVAQLCTICAPRHWAWVSHSLRPSPQLWSGAIFVCQGSSLGQWPGQHQTVMSGWRQFPTSALSESILSIRSPSVPSRPYKQTMSTLPLQWDMSSFEWWRLQSYWANYCTKSDVSQQLSSHQTAESL